ncbi:MAG: MarC family protein [Ignavibacteriae bacterium]|nr:MAG: MarC family protein [Ignavibacteriota bacterium]
MPFDFKIFLLSFIPLFVAIDVLGVVPLFVSLTDGMMPKAKKTLITEATLAALGVSVVFLFGGRMIFNYLGITENDFRVGGGIVLLVLAVYDLLFASDSPRKPQTSIGVVPLGIPLIIGPAALTTLLIIVDTHGYIAAVVALFVNLLFVWLIFRYSSHVTKLMGEAGSKAFSKVAALFMAAIAIMMIRVGLTAMIAAK